MKLSPLWILHDDNLPVCCSATVLCVESKQTAMRALPPQSSLLGLHTGDNITNVCHHVLRFYVNNKHNYTGQLVRISHEWDFLCVCVFLCDWSADQMDQMVLLLSLIADKSAACASSNGSVFVSLMFVWVIANSLANIICTWRNNCSLPRNLIQPGIFSLSLPPSLPPSPLAFLPVSLFYFAGNTPEDRLVIL